MGPRAGDGEPRRHRPADARRGDLDRDPRDRGAVSQPLGAGRGARAGAGGRERDRGLRANRSRRLPRRPGGPRRARGRLLGHPASRPGVLDAPGGPAAAARVDPLHRRRAGRPERALRVLRLPLHRDGAGDRAQPDRGTAQPARSRGRLPERDPDRELRVGSPLTDRPPLSRLDPTPVRLRRAPVLAQRANRSQLSDLRLGATRALHRDGVRDPAREWSGGGPAGARDRAIAPPTGRVSDRVPPRRPGRRPAQPGARARDRLRRRAPVHGG